MEERNHHHIFAESGFGVVELLVVAVITSVLLAISIPMYKTAKQRARDRDVVTAAQALQQAVAAYKSDHNNVAPPLGSVDWPLATANVGPVDRQRPGVAPQKYVRETPDSLTGGNVDLRRSPSTTLSAAMTVRSNVLSPKWGTIHYGVGANQSDFWFTVYTKRGNNLPSCFVSNSGIDPNGAAKPDRC